jgi:hypothetical protein
MLFYELIKADKILILKPQGALSLSDFESVSNEIDPFIEQYGDLNGILIQAESFPGWDSFSGFIRHLEFVKDHHKHVKKVAICSDDKILSCMQSAAKHFVKAKVKQFTFKQADDALAWVAKPV